MLNRAFTAPAGGRVGILLLVAILLITILAFTYPSLKPSLPAFRGRTGINNDAVGKGDLLDDVLNATLGVGHSLPHGLHPTSDKILM